MNDGTDRFGTGEILWGPGRRFRWFWMSCPGGRSTHKRKPALTEEIKDRFRRLKPDLPAVRHTFSVVSSRTAPGSPHLPKDHPEFQSQSLPQVREICDTILHPVTEDPMLFVPRPVLHIAGHFVFRPGMGKDPFLLVGGDECLSLSRVRNAGYDFNGVDLLTLSACETAMGGGKDENGREIEGFGAIAQNKGAKAVLATLWPVADESTGIFMQNLYRLRQEQGLSKAEALRRAQRIFIRGTQNPNASESGGPGCGKLVWNSSETGAEDAAFVPDPERPYAHPFYWAPFILMGNWL